MGLCCAKKKENEEEYQAPLRLSTHSTNSVLEKDNKSSRDSENTVNKTFDNTLKENELLLRSYKEGQSKTKDTAKNFAIGKFYDNGVEIWFRSIYVLETDSIRKQLLSLNNFDMRNTNRDKFEEWCDKNGYQNTKQYFDNFKLLDYTPLNRTLVGISHKYEVKMHISDIFLYKGRGPYRAVTCFGHYSNSIDRALNEYEIRLGKSATMPHLTKHWDNYIFPNPMIDISDHRLELPFKWVRRMKPVPRFKPKWPYTLIKSYPMELHQKIEAMLLEPKGQMLGAEYGLEEHHLQNVITRKSTDDK